MYRDVVRGIWECEAAVVMLTTQRYDCIQTLRPLWSLQMFVLCPLPHSVYPRGTVIAVVDVDC